MTEDGTNFNPEANGLDDYLITNGSNTLLIQYSKLVWN